MSPAKKKKNHFWNYKFKKNNNKIDGKIFTFLGGWNSTSLPGGIWILFNCRIDLRKRLRKGVPSQQKLHPLFQRQALVLFGPPTVATNSITGFRSTGIQRFSRHSASGRLEWQITKILNAKNYSSASNSIKSWK